MRRKFVAGSFCLLMAAVLGADKPELKTVDRPPTATHGTAVEFMGTPVEAAKLAAKQNKLVLVLHVSGYFENPDCTWNNAEALRVNALADRKVGELINKHFLASFQRVGSFKIDGKQKQGGNVATYFCAADGRVLNAIAGPVDAKTLLDETEWTIQKTREAIKESKGSADKFKSLMRKYHAERLRDKYGARVTPILKDQDMQDLKSALAYRDSNGRKLAPVLPLPPIENKAEVRQLSNLAKTHQLLAAHAGAKIENLYGAVFQGILNEKVTTKPVEIKTPFPWRKEADARDGR